MSSEEGISKADIVEIKSLSSPPGVVVKVCGAYGLMIGIGSDWATMKKHFGNMDCLEGMKRIDQSPLEEIPIDRQKRAKKMLRGLTYPEVMKVSKAASALFLFCQKNLELETENHNPKKSDEEMYSKKQIKTVPRPVFRSEYVQKGNFTEIKAFCAPPQIVKEVMTCFGLLVGIENPFDWVSIKKGLGASNFYKDKLGGFDIDKVDKKTIRISKSHFKKYVNESVAAIRAKSAAGAEIAKWCIEVYTYRPEEPPLSRQGTQLKMIFNLQVVDIQS